MHTSDDTRSVSGARPLALFLRANRRALMELLGASLLVNAFVLTLPLFSMLIYDKAVGNEIHETLWALAIGMALLLALEMSLRVARVYMIEHAGARWDARLDERLLRGILAAPMGRALPVGDMLARYREISATRDILSAQFMLPLADVPFVAMFAVALLGIGGPLVLVPLLTAAVMFGVSLWLQHMGRSRMRLATQAHGRKLGWLADVLLARESLADGRTSQRVVAAVRQAAHQGANASSRARLWQQMSQQVIPVGLTATSVLTLVVGVFLVENQVLSVGGLISSTMLGGRMLSSLCGLVPVISRWQEFKRALGGLAEVVDLDAPAPAASQREAAGTPAGETAFAAEGARVEALAFEYAQPGQEARRILDGLTFGLKAGELVVVVGASGAGKSTLLRLLSGHLGASAGGVIFAARSIKGDPARRWLAGQVAYKPQEAVFVGGLVSEIIAPGVTVPDDTALAAALRAAGLGPAIDRGEIGLGTTVGTNGLGVSGGQRQMLAVARVLASDCPLLLLDEPTLGLDRTAQDELIRALRARRDAGRCVVVATHATELIQAADRVLVLDRGKLVADAAPARLMAGAVATPPAASRAAAQSPALTPAPELAPAH